MKKKIIIILLISIIIIFLINKKFKSSRTKYYALGDYVSYSESMTNTFAVNMFEKNYEYFFQEDLSIENLLEYIKNGKYNISYNIDSSNYVTISIMNSEILNKLLNNKVSKKYYKKELVNYKNLIKYLSSYNTKKILIIGLYNPMINDKNAVNLYAYLNNELKKLTSASNIKYIDILDEIKEEHITNYKLNSKGQYLLLKKIKKLTWYKRILCYNT